MQKYHGWGSTHETSQNAFRLTNRASLLEADLNSLLRRVITKEFAKLSFFEEEKKALGLGINSMTPCILGGGYWSQILRGMRIMPFGRRAVPPTS